MMFHIRFSLFIIIDGGNILRLNLSMNLIAKAIQDLFLILIYIRKTT